MVVSLTDEQLPELLRSLQDDPQAYNVRGEITSRLNNVVTDFDFLVDSWPDYKALVIRVNPTAKFSVHLGRLVSVYTSDGAILETMLQIPGILDWSGNIAFLYVGASAMAPIENVIRKLKKPYEIHDHFFLKATKDTLKLSPVPEGFKVARLRPEQAYLISTTWKFSKGEHTELYLRNILEKLPSCCLYNKEGTAVGFAVQYHYGSLGMLYVLEEHRGKGYAKVIMSHLAALCLETRKEVFVISHVENIGAVRLHESIGFIQAPESKCAELWVNI